MKPRERHEAEQSAIFKTYQRTLFAVLDDAASELPAGRVQELLAQLTTRAHLAHGITPKTP